MTPRDFLSERILFGVLIIVGYLLAIGSAAYFPINGVSRDVVLGAVGALGTSTGMVIQAVFRTDKTDKNTAEAMANLTRGAPAVSPGP